MTNRPICARPGCSNQPRPGRDPTRRQPRYCTDHDNSAARTAAMRARRKLGGHQEKETT